jgi:hypothetical protein
MGHYLFLALAGMFLVLINMLGYDSDNIFSSYAQPHSSFDNIHYKYYVNQTNVHKCDFLNLCDQNNNVNLNGISDSYSKGIVDISYLKIDVNLPFP